MKLNDSEHKLCDLLLKKDITHGYELAEKIGLSQQQIRFMIARLRRQGLPIIANQHGYKYIYGAELKGYLEKRKKGINKQIQAYNAMRTRDFCPELRTEVIGGENEQK